MCENCGKSFASKEYLKHHNRIHSGFRPYKCETCGRAFAQRNSLHQHMKIHTGILHKWSNIDMHCTQKVQKWSLKSHVLKHIDNIKQFQLQFYERHQCAINNCIRNIVLDWQLLSNAQLMYGSQVCLYFTKCTIIKFKTSQLTPLPSS